MSLLKRYKKDPHETFDLKKKKNPAKIFWRKLSGFFSSSFSARNWMSVALPVIAFVLLISVFIVKIALDKGSVAEEDFKNENAAAMQDNIARIQRGGEALPEMEQEETTKVTEAVIEVTTRKTEKTLSKLPENNEQIFVREIIEENENNEISESEVIDESTGEYLYVATGTVNVREEASTDSEIIGKVYYNQALENLGKKDDFYRIKTEDGLIGFVHHDLLSEQISEEIIPGMDMYVQVGQAYIRSGPGTDHDIIGFGFKGTRLIIKEAGDSWSLVQTETGLRGYMLNELFGPRKVEKVVQTIETNSLRYINYEVVRMREKPSVNSEIISTLAMDDKVVQLVTDGSWSKIQTVDGLIGYVRNDLLRETAPVTPFVATNRNQYVTADVVNIRAENNTDSEILGKVKLDEKVLQIETDGTWSKVKTGSGIEGFMLNEYLSSVAPIPSESETISSEPEPSETEPTEPEDPFVADSGKVYVKVSAANLRAEPNTSSVVLDVLYYGAELDKISSNSSWTKVKTNSGQVGFISSNLYQNEPITDIEDPEEPGDGNNPEPVKGSKEGQRAAEIAYSMLGVPYVYGSSSPNGVDCSGLTRYCYAKLGVYLPHSANSQARNSGYPVSFSNSNFEATLVPGDLLFFNPYGQGYISDNYCHVGMYVGNGQMIHAPQPGEVVSLVSLYDHYSPVALAKRIFD